MIAHERRKKPRNVKLVLGMEIDHFGIDQSLARIFKTTVVRRSTWLKRRRSLFRQSMAASF